MAPIAYIHNRRGENWRWTAETIKGVKNTKGRREFWLDSKITARIQFLASGGLKNQHTSACYNIPSWEAAMPSVIYIFNEQV